MKNFILLIVSLFFALQMFSQSAITKTIESQIDSTNFIIDTLPGPVYDTTYANNYRLVITDSLEAGVVNTLTSPWQDSATFENTFYRRGFTDPTTGAKMLGVESIMHKAGVNGGKLINFEKEGRELKNLISNAGFSNYVGFQKDRLDIWVGQWKYKPPGIPKIIVDINNNERVDRNSDAVTIARIRPWDENYIEFKFEIQADIDAFGEKIIMYLTQDGPGYYEGRDKNDDLHFIQYLGN